MGLAGPAVVCHDWDTVRWAASEARIKRTELPAVAALLKHQHATPAAGLWPSPFSRGGARAEDIPAIVGALKRAAGLIGPSPLCGGEMACVDRWARAAIAHNTNDYAHIDPSVDCSAPIIYAGAHTVSALAALLADPRIVRCGDLARFNDCCCR